jgi:DNA invertase Pin-like site-specific DNA recombinase
MTTERQPIAYEILPGQRPRKHESSVTTYEEIPGLVPVGNIRRMSVANAESIERQRVDERIKAAGAYVHRDYVDPDHSGSKRNVYRPAVELASTDLVAGIIQGVAVADIDRLTRLDGVIDHWCNLYEDNERAWRKGHAKQWFWYCNDSEIDLRTDEGRNNARDAVRTANKEARKIARRQRDRHETARAKGKMVGRRGFGYTTTGEIVPDEAKVIRQLADAVDKGILLGPILRSLEVNSVTGSKLTHRTVREVITGGRVVGLRVDKSNVSGEWAGIALDPNGLPIKGNQSPILVTETREPDIALWQRLRKLYREREIGNERRTYFATGSLRCKACKKGYTGSTERKRGSHNYKCPCGTYLNGPQTDAYLKTLVELELERNPVAVAAPVPWPKQAELDEVEADRQATELEMAEGDPASWIRLEKGYVKAIGRLNAERREWLKAHPMPKTLPPDALLSRWETGEVSIMRGVLRDVFAAIWVAKASGGFDPDWFNPIPRND